MKTPICTHSNSRTMGWFVLAGLSWLVAGPLLALEVPLVASGSSWRYLDDGSDQGSAWTAITFDDSAWSEGGAQLGYGDGDEVTLVDFGPDPMDRWPTTYLRARFEIDDPQSFIGLRFDLLRDDGVVVYLNGEEVFRNNMPEGDIGFETLALEKVGGTDENRFFSTASDAALLVTGTNVIAVSLHQNSVDSSDLSFDLGLIGFDDSPKVVRGPYLQMAGPHEVTVRWRTDKESDAMVLFGTDPGALTSSASSAALGHDHEVTLSNLDPQSLYYYALGTTETVLAGGGPTDFFSTPPPAGSDRPVRIWVLGDSGVVSDDVRNVRDAYRDLQPSRLTDLWLLLGDNAYSDGDDGDYQAALFEMFPDTLRTAPVWSTLGNHDSETADSGTETGPYYDIFSFPRAGELGGVASGTEAYYSFDYGGIHFINLDSADSILVFEGPMMDWLEDDLAANTAAWTIAFWHHPPYTKGSHDSDTEGRLTNMRENAVVLLEDYGVDLVLSGHSHSYERSFFIDSHYGLSNEFDDTMKVDGGDGNPEGDGAYRKESTGPVAHSGAVFVVAGNASQLSGGELNHPAMETSLNELGSLIVDVHDQALKVRFLDDRGGVADQFSILKAGAQELVELEAIPARGPAGSTFELVLTGAAPGEVVNFGGSIQGPGEGPCPQTFGGLCLDLLAPALFPNEVVADDEGRAVLELTVPVTAQDGRYPFQAVVPRGPEGEDSAKTNLAFFIVDSGVAP